MTRRSKREIERWLDEQLGDDDGDIEVLESEVVEVTEDDVDHDSPATTSDVVEHVWHTDEDAREEAA